MDFKERMYPPASRGFLHPLPSGGLSEGYVRRRQLAHQLYEDWLSHDRAPQRRFLLPKQPLRDKAPHRLQLLLHGWRPGWLVWGRHGGDQAWGSGPGARSQVQLIRTIGGTGDPMQPASKEQQVPWLDI